jgi:hypothetical protein
LADEFDDLCVQRNAMSSESGLPSSQREYEGGVHRRPVPFDVRQRRFRILSEKRDMVIEKIRQIDGLISSKLSFSKSHMCGACHYCQRQQLPL